jgi:hypothetical protein
VETDIQCSPSGGTHDIWCHVGRVSFSLSEALPHVSTDCCRYDEGTALMPVVSSTSQLPVHPTYKFLALDADGYDLPSDWYMRVVGFAAEGFHGERTLLETFPVKELQDYWGTRPHYEEIDTEKVQQRLTDEAGNAFRAWEAAAAGQGAIDEAPPPPYTEEEIQQEEVRQQRVQGSQAQLGQSSGGASNPWPQLSQDAGPAPALPARHSSLTVSGAAASFSSASLGRSQSAHPPAVDMSSHPSQPVRKSTKPQYPPEKVEVVMAPPTVHSRRQSSPSGPNTSASISSLADDFSRQNISASPSWPSTQSTYQPGHATSYSSSPTVGMPSSSTSPPNDLGHGPGGWRPPAHSPRPSLPGGTHSPPWQPVHAPSQGIFYSPSQIPSHLPQLPPQSLRPGSHPPSPPTRPHDVMAFPGVTHYGGSGSGTPGFPSPGHMNPSSSSYAPQGQSQESYPYYYYNQTTTGGPQPPGPYAPYGYGHDNSHTPHSHSPPPMMAQGGVPAPSIPPRTCFVIYTEFLWWIFCVFWSQHVLIFWRLGRSSNAPPVFIVLCALFVCALWCGQRSRRFWYRREECVGYGGGDSREGREEAVGEEDEEFDTE